MKKNRNVSVKCMSALRHPIEFDGRRWRRRQSKELSWSDQYAGASREKEWERETEREKKRPSAMASTTKIHYINKMGKVKCRKWKKKSLVDFWLSSLLSPKPRSRAILFFLLILALFLTLLRIVETVLVFSPYTYCASGTIHSTVNYFVPKWRCQ